MARMREKNVGVVAVEAPIASSEEHREQLNDIFTRAIASDASPEDIEHAELADEQGLCAQVLHELKGTGKRVELIGFTLDSPGLLAAEQMSQDSIRLDSSTLEQQPNDVLRDAAASLVVSMAQSNGPRNNDMAEQLDELSRKYPGTRIGVFASSAHEPVVEMLGVRGHRKIDRVFINANGEEREHEHPNGVLLAQNMQESGLRELTRDELNRVVLEHTLGFKMNELGEASPLSFAGRIVRTMPEERVEELLGVIDEIKANSETRGDAWRSIGQLALMVNTEYTLRQDAADNRHTEQGGAGERPVGSPSELISQLAMSELVELQEITSPGGWNHVIRSERRRRELTLTELYIHTPTTFESPETEAETLESSLYLSVVRDSCQDYGFPSSDFTPFKGGQSRIKDAAADFVDNNEIPGKLSRRSKVDFFANSLVPVVFSARLIGSKEFNDSRRAFLRHRFPGVIPVASRPSLIERFKDQPIHGSEVQAAADVLSEQTAIKTPYPDFLQLSPNQQASIINALGKEWQQLCALVQEHDPTLFTSLKYRTQSPLAYLSVEELRATIAENPQIRPGRLCAAFLESPRTFYDELPKLRQYRISDP